MQNIYKDRWLKVIGSFIVSLTVDSIGRTESIFERLATGSFYVDLFAGFAVTLFLWELIGRTTVYLDKNYAWFENPLERFLLQFLFGVTIPVLLSFMISLVYMRLLWEQDIFGTDWLNTEIYMVTFIIVLINFIYFSWWLYLKYAEKANTNSIIFDAPNGDQPTAPRENPIKVTKGARTVLLSPSEIAYIYLIDGYSYLQKFDGEDFVSSLSLEDFDKKLGREHFFRVNRQFILQRKACASFRSIENGKIEVEVVPKPDKRVIVSQKKARAFRKWSTTRN